MWITSTFVLYLFINYVESRVDYLQHPVKSCHIGDKVENECNKCSCSTKSVFECTPKECDKNAKLKRSEDQQLCLPNQLYVQNLITCICTKDGRWPHKSCDDTFQSLSPTTVDKYECVPDTYVTIDCNVCRCGTDGDIILGRCTRNICESEHNRRSIMEPNNANVYSTCDVKNWYSLAPCQFCYCVNQNKLMCNTGNYYSKNLELGTYNLRVCGKNLIKEAIELMPESDSVLRLGNVNESTTRTPHASITPGVKLIPLKQNRNINIELNRESNENKTNRNKQFVLNNQVNLQELNLEEVSSSDKEYYSDSEEETLTLKPKIVQKAPKLQNPLKPRGINILSTWKPLRGHNVKLPVAPQLQTIEEEIEPLNESNEEMNGDPNEIVVELDQRPHVPVDRLVKSIAPQSMANKQFKNNLRQGTEDDSYKYVGNTLKINLPQVLNKVFQMALRKSMVSLSSATKCVPGSTSMGKCNNMCFCLKNSKLLCTNNKCDEKKQ